MILHLILTATAAPLYYAMCKGLTTAVTRFVTDGTPPPPAPRTITLAPYTIGEVLPVLHPHERTN